MTLSIRPAIAGEAPLVLQFVRELAEYEKLTHEIDATDARSMPRCSGHRRASLAISQSGTANPSASRSGLNFSSFRGRNGIYLEDIFVRRPARQRHRQGAARASCAPLW